MSGSGPSRKLSLKPEIVCVGNIVVDAVGINVEKIPDEGSLTLFDRVEMHMGGCANNVATALAKLGLNVGLIAKVGKDGLGEFALGELVRQGIDVRGVKVSPKDSTSFSFIILPKSGDRRILHTMAANATFGLPDMDVSMFDGVKWVCIGGLAIVPTLDKDLAKVLKAARKAGAHTAADTAVNDRFSAKDWERLLAPCYELLDVLFPSEEEARAITGQTDPEKICESFYRRGVKIAGVKLGAKGCAILSKEGFHRIPVYKVNCVDTLGAGDCFMAGLIAGLLRGLPPVDAARLGNAVSAHCVQAVGATTGIPPLDKVLAFQKKSRVK
jgi:sugar/nucleoside kinase (ribokinase family)